MKTLRVDPLAGALATLGTIEGLASPRPPVSTIVLRLVCTRCGGRFFGSNLTPHICPSCESDEILQDAM